jgi:hypothetical protein
MTSKMNLNFYISPLLSVQKSKEIFSFEPAYRPDLQYSYYTYTGYTADLVVLLPPQKIEGQKRYQYFIHIYLFLDLLVCRKYIPNKLYYLLFSLIK